MSLPPPGSEQGFTQQKQTLWDQGAAGHPSPSPVTINSAAFACCGALLAETAPTETPEAVVHS